jgi:hypothetical protein
MVGVRGQKSLEVGLTAGTTYYLGDINPYLHFLRPKVAYGALVRLNFSTRWTARLTGIIGKVEGDDNILNYVENRGLRFRTNIFDISAVGEFNFFDYFTGSKKNNWTPYIYGGVGVIIYNPKVDGTDLRSLGTEGQNVGFNGRSQYGKFAVTVPFGVGFKFSLNRRISATVEWGMRKTLTDYLDDVSTTYYLYGSEIDPASTDQLLSDPTRSHEPYQERGNSGTDDWVGFAGITLTYKINLLGNRRCPDQRQ